MPASPTDPELSVAQVNRKVALGAAFMVLGRLAVRLISIVSTLLLVRLLVPEDFGLIALAGAAVAVADTLTATGYAVIVVRRPTVDRGLYDTVWTMNLLRALLLGGVVAATAGWQARMLGDARLELIIYVIAFTIALDGLMSVGLIRLQRELRFNLLFRHQIAARLVSFTVTIGLACWTQHYLCLVLGGLVAKLFAIAYSHRLAPHRPSLSLRDWREFLTFSKWMFAMNICSMADGSLPTIMLGRFQGVRALGVFNASYQVAAAPVTELAVPVRGPIYAGYARVVNNPPLLGRQIADGFGLLAAVLVPMSVGIALVAPEIERIALGPAWAGAAAIIAPCALYALGDAFGHFTFNIFAILDRYPRLVGIFASLVSLRMVCVLLAAWHGGLLAVATVLMATGLLNAMIWTQQACQVAGLRLAEVWSEVWRSLGAAGFMTGAVLLVRANLSAGGETGWLASFGQLLLLVATGVATHVMAQWLLWRLAGAPSGAETKIFAAALKLRPRLWSARAAA
ncbi:oligosaccharide flippase family protein [Belnapia moabensis]|uniref:oligosaccharide flippase family protein n=1 Tax=Belnapia moabensis TaxID=365533 RepID=UPI0005B76FA6|nr:oligosaccharide flippase family protein [Belnapia moabensis]